MPQQITPLRCLFPAGCLRRFGNQEHGQLSFMPPGRWALAAGCLVRIIALLAVVEAGGSSAATREGGCRARALHDIRAGGATWAAPDPALDPRSFVSDIGRRLYGRCKAMLIEAEAAAARIERCGARKAIWSTTPAPWPPVKKPADWRRPITSLSNCVRVKGPSRSATRQPKPSAKPAVASGILGQDRDQANARRYVRVRQRRRGRQIHAHQLDDDPPGTDTPAFTARCSHSPVLAGGMARGISLTWPSPTQAAATILPDAKDDE